MEVVVIPCLHDNYSYLVSNGAQALLVDPSEAWPAMRELGARNLTLSAVLCTHHHQDHIGGLEDLRDEYQGLEVFGHHRDRDRIPALTRPLADGERFTVCGLEAEVFFTPGHTATHVAYRIGDSLFVGDTLFGAGCGRLFEGTAEQMVRSLARLTACGPKTRVCFGHEYTEVNLRFAAQVDPGNPAVPARAARVAELRRRGEPSSPSTIEEELATNPFLRLEDPAIIARLQAEHGLAAADRVAVFAALREMRNHFS